MKTLEGMKLRGEIWKIFNSTGIDEIDQEVEMLENLFMLFRIYPSEYESGGT